MLMPDTSCVIPTTRHQFVFHVPGCTAALCPLRCAALSLLSPFTCKIRAGSTWLDRRKTVSIQFTFTFWTFRFGQATSRAGFNNSLIAFNIDYTNSRVQEEAITTADSLIWEFLCGSTFHLDAVLLQAAGHFFSCVTEQSTSGALSETDDRSEKKTTPLSWWVTGTTGSHTGASSGVLSNKNC